MTSIDRKDMFGSLHGDIESPIFIKEEAAFSPGMDGCHKYFLRVFIGKKND